MRVAEIDFPVTLNFCLSEFKHSQPASRVTAYFTISKQLFCFTLQN